MRWHKAFYSRATVAKMGYDRIITYILSPVRGSPRLWMERTDDERMLGQTEPQKTHNGTHLPKTFCDARDFGGKTCLKK